MTDKRGLRFMAFIRLCDEAFSCVSGNGDISTDAPKR